MSILPPAPAPHRAGPRFACAPWHDQHPNRRALEARLSQDHLARTIEAAVQRLDLSALDAAYAGTGSDPYPPALLLRAVLFATRRGVHSPATWFRDAHECEPVRWLLRGCCPSRSCWYAFRDRLAPVLTVLNAQPLQAAIHQGLTPATRGAADGTLVAANASRHHLLNETRLDGRLTELAAALTADAQGQLPAAVPSWMAQGPHSRLVISASDPEAALGLDKEKVFRPLYNVQLIDDLDTPFILSYAVFAQPNDAGLVGALLLRAQELLGQRLRELLADTAYVGGADLQAAATAGVTVY